MDEIDVAQANDEMFTRQALTAHFRRRAGEFGAMLACGEAKSIGRIKLGNRGKCCDCGDEIEPARLEAKPDAIRCIDCQQKSERGKRIGV